MQRDTKSENVRKESCQISHLFSCLFLIRTHTQISSSVLWTANQLFIEQTIWKNQVRASRHDFAHATDFTYVSILLSIQTTTKICTGQCTEILPPT